MSSGEPVGTRTRQAPFSLRGILAEIPPENGRRRFLELSGVATLMVERDAKR